MRSLRSWARGAWSRRISPLPTSRRPRFKRPWAAHCSAPSSTGCACRSDKLSAYGELVAEQLEDGTAAADAADVDRVVAQADRARLLLQCAQALSRPTGGEVDLAAALDAALPVARQTQRRHPVGLHCPPQDPCAVAADPEAVDALLVAVLVALVELGGTQLAVELHRTSPVVLALVLGGAAIDPHMAAALETADPQDHEVPIELRVARGLADRQGIRWQVNLSEHGLTLRLAFGA